MQILIVEFSAVQGIEAVEVERIRHVYFAGVPARIENASPVNHFQFPSLHVLFRVSALY